MDPSKTDDNIDKLQIIGECQDKLLEMIKNKENEWRVTSKVYIESNDLPGAAMVDQWAFACSLIHSLALCEFSKILGEAITEINEAPEADNEVWSCNRQMNG
jgi:hypothetical protein